MKQLIGRTLTSLLLIVVWAAGTAYAQSPAVIRVNIPFEFSVGDKAFAPGNYSLIQPLPHLLVLRDARGKTIATTFTSGIESSNVTAISKLKFRAAEGRYILAEVWTQDLSSGQKVYPVKADSYVAKRSAEARQTAEGSQP